MKLLSISKFCSVACLAMGLLAASPSATAQSLKGYDVGDPKFESIPSPDISTGKNKRFKPKDWLEMEIEIKVKKTRSTPKSGYLDGVQVNWYVLFKNPEKSGTFLKLNRTVKHVNMPVGEGVFASAYISPATLRRISGSDRASEGIVEYVGAEVLIDGKKVGMVTNKKLKGKVDWWNVASASIAEATGYKLLTKAETPFKFLWWDRYLEVDESAR